MKLTQENTSKLQQLEKFYFETQQLETELTSLKNDLVSLLVTIIPAGLGLVRKGQGIIWPSPALGCCILLCRSAVRANIAEWHRPNGCSRSCRQGDE